MKIAKQLLIALALSFCTLACSTPKTNVPSKPFPLGDYQYTGFDDKGTKIVEGRLSILSAEPMHVDGADTIQLKGNWELKMIGNPERIGPQVGKGDLIGSINNKDAWIDLNPGIDDNNVNLKGSIEGTRFHGTWSFDGFISGMNKGTFEATRK